MPKTIQRRTGDTADMGPFGMGVTTWRCNCPCNRCTPKVQGVQEIERTGLRMERCQCPYCGVGERGCHHRVPPSVHRCYGGMCWLCYDEWQIANALYQPDEPSDDDLVPEWWPPLDSQDLAAVFDQWQIPNDQAPVVPLDDASTQAPASGPPSSSSGATSSSPTAGPTSCLRRELYPITPLVVSTVACVEAMGPGYLSVDSDVVIEILYMGDPEDVDQAGWVYAEIRANGRRGWLPITVLPSSNAWLGRDTRLGILRQRLSWFPDTQEHVYMCG